MRIIKHLYPYFVLSFLLIGVFLFTIQVRKPWFGQLINGDHHYLTGSTLKFARIWYHEKPWNIAFGLIEQPLSIEHEILQKREPYASYPPGTILPIYVISLIMQKEPTVSMVMGFNLFNHIVTALLLSYIAFFLLKKYESNILSLSLSWIPGIMFLLLPGVMFWQQNIYFADQAVILPFVLIMFIEIVRDYCKNKRIILILNILQTIAIVYGSMTDYLFFFLLCFLYIKRLLYDNRITSLKTFIIISIKFWWPAILFYMLFFIQIWYLGALNQLKDKFIQRTGIELVEKKISLKFFEIFWLQHIINAYGKQAFWLIWISLFNLVAWSITFLTIIRKKIDTIEQKQILRTLLYSIIFTLPQFLQIYLLQEHSYVHDFSTFKFSLILILIPFVFIPFQFIQISKIKSLQKCINIIIQYYFTHLIILIILFVFFLHQNINKEDFLLLINYLFLTLPIFIFVGLLLVNKGLNRKIILTLIIIFVILLIYKNFPQYKIHFGKSNVNFENLGNAIRKCTNYDDIYVSPIYNAPSNPPQMLAFTMKPIHKITAFNQINKIVSTISKPYNLVAIFPQNPKIQYKNWLEFKVSERICEGNYYVLLNKRIIQ